MRKAAGQRRRCLSMARRRQLRSCKTVLVVSLAVKIAVPALPRPASAAPAGLPVRAPIDPVAPIVVLWAPSTCVRRSGIQRAHGHCRRRRGASRSSTSALPPSNAL